MSNVKRGERQAITAMILAILPLGALGLMSIASWHQIRAGTWEVAFFELIGWTYYASIVLYPISFVLSICALRNRATNLGCRAFTLSVLGFIFGLVMILLSWIES